MLLSDTDIRHALSEGTIKVTPPVRDTDIRPAGLRLHLSNQVAVPAPDGSVISISDDINPHFDHIFLDKEGIVLEPNQFVLASTVERVWVSTALVAQLDGRSTLARLGLQIHCGSMIIDNVHDDARAITLEIFNAGSFRVRLCPGDRIGMLFFSALQQPISQPASTQYSGQLSVTTPRLRRVS